MSHIKTPKLGTQKTAATTQMSVRGSYRGHHHRSSRQLRQYGLQSLGWFGSAVRVESGDQNTGGRVVDPIKAVHVDDVTTTLD